MSHIEILSAVSAVVLIIATVVAWNSKKTLEYLGAIGLVTALTLWGYFLCEGYDLYLKHSNQLLGACLLGSIVCAMGIHFGPSRTWKRIACAGGASCFMVVAFAVGCNFSW